MELGAGILNFPCSWKLHCWPSISTAPHPGIYWGKNPHISRRMQFKPVLFKAQVYMDVYNQPTKMAAMQMASGTTTIWLSLEALSVTLLFHFMSVLFFLVSLVRPTVPWHRQLWFHILEFTIWWIQVYHIRFTTSGAKGTSCPKLFENTWRPLVHLSWVTWPTINQPLWPKIGNDYWSSLSHMPALVASKERFYDCYPFPEPGWDGEKWFSKIIDFPFQADKTTHHAHEKIKGSAKFYVHP